jgi:ArsR family transcriptional regulator
MLTSAPSLLDSFSALSDATRCRMLWLLDRHELTVSELCTVLQLPQSTVSRHLRLLSDADWVISRRGRHQPLHTRSPSMGPRAHGRRFGI